MHLATQKGRTFEYFLAGIFFVWVIIAWGWQNLLPHFRLVNLIVSIYVVAVLFFRKGWKNLRFTKIGGILFLFALWQSVSLFWTPLPAYAIDDVSQFVLLVILYFVLSSYFSEGGQIRVWENVFIFVTLTLVLIALRESWHWYSSWWQEWASLPPFMERLSSKIIGHPNVLAGIINLAIPLIFVRVLQRGPRIRRLLNFMVLLIFFLALYLTSSRGGWVSGMVGIGALLLALFGEVGLRKIRGTGFQKIFSVRVFLYLGIVILVSAVVISGLILNLRQSPAHGGRLDIWSHAWKIWQEQILFGRGAGSFELLYARQIQYPPGFWAVHAHNGILQIGAELGIVGIALLLGLMPLVFRNWRRAYRSIEADACRYRLAAYAGIFGAVFAHQLIDFPFYSPVYALVVLLFVLWVEGKNTHENTIAYGKIPALIISLLLLIFFVGSWSSLQGLAGYWRGIMSSWNEDWPTVHDEFCELANRYPGKSFYGFQCGLAGLYVYDQTGDERALIESLDAQQAALEHDSFWPSHWANLSFLEWYSGDRADAKISMLGATELAAEYAYYWLNLGWMYEEMSDWKNAEESYQKALSLEPWLQFSPYFNHANFRRNFLDDWLQVNQTNMSPNQLSYYWYQMGEHQISREILQQRLSQTAIDQDTHAIYGVVLNGMGQQEYAWEKVQYARSIKESPRVLGWVANIARLRGEDDLALKYLKSASMMQNHHYGLDGYLNGIYHRWGISGDHPPQFLNPMVTPELVDGYLWLIENYQLKGERELAESLRHWLLLMEIVDQDNR